MLVICQSLVSLEHENMIFEKQIFCFYVKMLRLFMNSKKIGLFRPVWQYRKKVKKKYCQDL